MQQLVAKLCLLLALSHFSLTEWVEISHSHSQPIEASKQVKQLPVEGNVSPEGFTTPSAVWIEYQRERFGLSNSQSNPLIVSDAGGLKHTSQIVVPNGSQVIHARTKLVVRNSSSMPPVEVDLVVTPKVETTSRRHSSHVESAEDADGIVETATEPSDTDVDDDELQLPSMQGFIKFLKKMQVGWIKKSALNFESKIKLLKQLRDTFMKVIEQQFSVLWQPTERHRRRRRSLLDESNLDFPPEAALMSINFLTFAVFLIKLVLVS
ncbi:uncharacterized protein [Drosophila virilis]|uniref:uncharacterized protein n=1 Tax=Drosophila virilis TaxID=7244 RepID=UPI0038B386C3